MLNRRVDDQYCLAKIRSVVDFDLDRLSFSDSDLQYLNKPLSSPTVSDDLKLKYLNCYRGSMQIYSFKSSAKSQRKGSVRLTGASSHQRKRSREHSFTDKHSFADKSMADNLIDQRSDCSPGVGQMGNDSSQYARYNSERSCSLSQTSESPVFDIDKIHNYRDNRSLIGSSSGNLSDLSSFDSNQLNFDLNETLGSSSFNRKVSNLSIYKQLTRSDPELYSTNLLSSGDTDGETREKQLFYLKTIYLTFKSLNLLEKFRGFRHRTTNFLSSIKPEVLSDKDAANKRAPRAEWKTKDTTNDHDDKVNNVEEAKPRNKSDLETAPDRPNGQVNGGNKEDRESESGPKIETKADGFAKPTGLNPINLDKVLSCVDLKRKQLLHKKQDETNLDELEHFLNSNEFSTKTILNKIESLASFDPNLHRQPTPKVNSNAPQIKPIRASGELFSPFFRLNLLDNFVTRSISNKLPAFSSKPTPPAPSNTERCNCNCKHRTDSHDPREEEMDVIDLNDANNYKYYKDSIFDSFDLDVKDEEAIRLEFDRKFESFLEEDLKQFRDRQIGPFRLESSVDSSALQSATSQPTSQLTSPMASSSCGTSKGSEKSEQFDSIKRLSSLQSRIPVLQRDKSKFSKAMLGKLKIRYDPLNARKHSKELIDALNEGYESILRSGGSAEKLASRPNAVRAGVHQSNVGSIDKLNNKLNQAGKSRSKATPKTAAIKSLKSANSLASLKSIKPMRLLESTGSLKSAGEDTSTRSKPDSSTATVFPSKHFNLSSEPNNRNSKSLRDSYLSHRESAKFSSYRPSRIPKFMHEECTDEHLLINRKGKPIEAKRTVDGQKFDKFYHLIKETTGGIFRGTAKEKLPDRRPDNEPTGDDRATDERPAGQQDYQVLRKCVPRTKSESFINEQLDSRRINENYRNRLLELELKTNGNCLFQLYDYFDDFKDKSRKDRK